MNFLNLGGAAATGYGRGTVSGFRHGPALADRSAPLPRVLPPLPTPPPRPSLTQVLGAVWTHFRLALARRGMSSGKLLRTAGMTTLLLAGWHWAYPWAAFSWHQAAGQAAENNGSEQDAIGEYAQMIALQSHNPEGYARRARACYIAFQYGQAIADETQVLRLTSNPQERAISRMWRGYDYDLSGDHARGIADFTASLAISPTIPDTEGQTADASDKTPDAHKGRLWAYWRSKQYALAARDCDALIAADPATRAAT